ncbi:MAG: class I SAM-dependent methyltransferase [Rhizobium sp.]|nr:class I SAM-dependent methyltransferase [Rhizobium sp.]
MEKNYEALNLTQPESENDPFTEDRYRQFYKFLPMGARSVLDIGCNTGRGGSVLKKLNSSLLIYGLDAVRDRLDRLPQDAYERGVHGFSTKIPNEDGTYDVVVAGEFIEHIYQADVDQTLGEIFRVLKIGGRLMLTTPNPYDFKRKWRGHSILGGAHVSQHFPDALRIKLRMCGFSNVKIYGSGKVSRYLGMRFPTLSIYGSYLAIADKK